MQSVPSSASRRKRVAVEEGGEETRRVTGVEEGGRRRMEPSLKKYVLPPSAREQDVSTKTGRAEETKRGETERRKKETREKDDEGLVGGRCIVCFDSLFVCVFAVFA